ncbi:tyrosine-type recombinase/integrase [Streptomyces scopuliridis]|uniref:tyrosine-type recombinase/integrase n=1 Tax=Streptomyces scopuliridis TaxID=452529 RepID=UPI0036A766BB
MRLTNRQGKRQEFYLGTSKAAAETVIERYYMDDILPDEVAQGDHSEDRKLLFRDWAADWLSRRRAKESSIERYEIAIRVHLNPRWGSHRYVSIKKAQVEAWVREMEANEKIANSTAEGHWKVFQMITKDALQNGKITVNPCYEVEGPYVEKTKPYIFSDDEIWAVYDEFPERYRPIPLLGYGCGVRQAEAFATCTDVIDRKSGLLTVHRQVLSTKEFHYRATLVDRLKTSRRKNGIHSKTVPIPDHTMEAIDKYEAKYPARPTQTILWRHGKTVDTCDRGPAEALFWTPRGNLVSRDTFNEDAWKPTLRKLGIKQEDGTLPTFHDTRHTYISKMLQNGMKPETVALWVGDSVEEIRRTYNHLLKEQVEDHRSAITRLTARPLRVVGAA